MYVVTYETLVYKSYAFQANVCNRSLRFIPSVLHTFFFYSATRKLKHLRVLYVKPSNKMYVLIFQEMDGWLVCPLID